MFSQEITTSVSITVSAEDGQGGPGRLTDAVGCCVDTKTTAAVVRTAGDHFKDESVVCCLSFLFSSQLTGQQVPKEYLDKEHVDLKHKKVFGVNACTAAAYDPVRKALIDDFEQGWEELMRYDWATTRSYLTRGEPNYPLSVVQWIEDRNIGFDRGFSEVGIFTLPSLRLKSISRPFLALSNSTIPPSTSSGHAWKAAARF